MAILAFSSNNIFDSTSAGRALLTAADASAQRTLLGLSSSSAVSFQSLVLSGQSLTGSTATSVFDATTTWNTTGTPVAWKLNVTDTASGGNPLLIDLQANSSSRFDVTAKVAATYIGQFSHNGLPRVRFSAQSSGAAIEIFAGSSNSFIGFGTIGSTVSRLYAEDASNGIIGQRNGVNPQTFRVYNTFTDISNYERAKIAWESNVLVFGTEKLGTGASRAIQIHTGGAKQITIGSGGPELSLGSNASPPAIYAMNSIITNTASPTGQGIGFRSDVNDNDSYGFIFTGATGTITSSTLRVVQIERSFFPTSGTGNFTALRLRNQIQQTGGANGITRGIHVDPYIWAAADWRSIETSNNTGYAFYAAGTANSYFGGSVGIGTTSPAQKLHVYSSVNSVAAFESSGSATIDIFRTSLTGIRLQAIGGSSQSVIGSTAGGRSITLCHDASGGSITNGVGIGNTPVITDIRATLSVRSATTAARTVSIEKLASQTADLFVVSSDAAAYPDTTNIGNFFKIAADGKIGIGTTSLTRQLNVEGGDGIRSNPASSNLFSLAGWKRALEITKDSAILTSLGGTTYSISQSGNNFYIGYSSANDASSAISYRLFLDSSGNVGVGTTSPTAKLDIAGTTEIKDGINAQSFRVYNTYTNASNYERAKFAWSSNILQIGTEALGTGTARDLDLQINGVTRVKLTNTGSYGLVVNSGLEINSGGSPTVSINGSGIYDTNLEIISTARRYRLAVIGSTSPGPGDYANTSPGQFGIYDGNAGLFRLLIGTTGNVGIGNYAPAAKLDITDTTLSTGSNSGGILNLAQTWNTTGTPTAIKLNVTNTASGGVGRLLDLQVGGTSVFNVGRDGVVRNASIAAAYADGVCITAQAAARCFAVGYLSGNNVQLGSTTSFGWTAGADSYAALETILVRDAAHTIAQRNGVNAQVFRLYNTFTDSSNYERGIFSWSSSIFQIGTEKLGTGVARTMDLLTDGTTRLRIASDGYLFLGNGGTNNIRIYNQISGAGVLEANTNGIAFDCRVRSGTTASSAFWVYYGNDCTSGTQNLGRFSGGFNPTSGTADHNNLLLGMTINQTGGASGITRGLYVNPILTAAADWRAIEVANGQVVFTDTYAAGSGSLAGSLLNLSQTWNTTGTPTAIKLNVTDTASNSNSILMDLQVGGSSRFKVEKSGSTVVTSNLYLYGTGDADVSRTGVSQWSSGARAGFVVGGVFRFITVAGYVMQRSDSAYSWSPDTNLQSQTPDLLLYRDASGALAQRNGVNSQIFRVYNTYTDASNYERAKFAWESNVLRIGTEKLGTGTARQLDLQTDGTTRISIAGNGTISTNNAVSVVSSFIATIAQVGVAGSGTQYCYDAGTTTYSGTSGSTSIFACRSSFAPTSGTMNFTGFTFLSTINQTGGANGITRGIYINPTLTSAADFRAIEVTAGKTIVAPSTTTSASLNIPSGTAPTSPVDGDIWFDGTALKIRIGGVTKTVTVT